MDSAEVHEAFTRFRKGQSGAEGNSSIFNPYTLLVAVGLSARLRRRCQQGDTRAVSVWPTRRQKMPRAGEEKVRDYIKTIGLYRN